MGCTHSTENLPFRTPPRSNIQDKARECAKKKSSGSLPITCLIATAQFFVHTAVIAGDGPGVHPQQFSHGGRRLLQVQGELWVGDDRPAILQGKGVSGDDGLMPSEIQGDMPRRVSRRRDHLAAAAPIQHVAIVQKHVDRDRFHPPQKVAKSPAQLLPLRRQRFLKRLGLRQPLTIRGEYAKYAETQPGGEISGSVSPPPVSG